ncbi:hypothetical protein V3331_13955 [Gaopeijia maritima]|uniref:hypothetical protein n=1 Tax=Gaopeijia maritima TaxID=3119007 RepID=UPI003253EF68
MDRARPMGHRLDEGAAERGVDEVGRQRIARIHDAAMELRRGAGVGQHHRDYLHPGRSALILLIDLGEADATTLCAAIAFDSERADWIPRAAVADDRDLAMRVAELPPAGADDLAERLVVADEAVRRAALAERLDQLRHAHLWPDLEARRRAHAEAEAVYAPIARRTHPVFARRYDWWCGMFATRHLTG